MAYSSALIIRIKSTLERECTVHAEYVKAISEQTKAMTPFKGAEVERLNEVRAELCERMEELQNQRRALVAELSDGANMPLSEAAEKYCSAEDKRALFPLIRRLKTLALQARSETHELSDITTFSLSIVNSVISIIHSGGEGVARSYTGRGILKESYHPGAARVASVLKQA